MKIHSKFLAKLGGFAIANTIRNWLGTLSYQRVLYDESADPASSQFQGPAIFLFWHEYIACPFYLRGNTGIAMLLSQHRDADWLADAAPHMGFDTIRGSTYRGGTKALLKIMRELDGRNLAITPDGPRGPRRRMAQGPIYVASRTGMPLILLGIGYSHPWRMPTWDRFALPRPYSDARVIAGPKIHLPRDLDRNGVEHYRQQMETLLNRLTIEAEAWAASGKGHRRALSVRREGRPWWADAGPVAVEDDLADITNFRRPTPVRQAA